MSKKHKKHEEHVDESWLIPYADILTLLLALFIVLFASSSVDQAKFEQISATFSEIFDGGTGIMENPVPVPTTINEPTTTKDVEEVLTGGKTISVGETEKVVEEEKEQNKETEKETKTDEAAIEEEFKKLGELQKKIDGYIEQKGLGMSLKTNLTENGLLITISDSTIFDSGSAEIRSEAITLIREMSELLYSDPPRQIQIAGHTDNVPISTSSYRDNWDLSSMRALNFMRIVLENKKLEPEKFIATGYGEYRPIETNKTSIGREKNRRVEVLILPRFETAVDASK